MDSIWSQASSVQATSAEGRTYVMGYESSPCLECSANESTGCSEIAKEMNAKYASFPEAQ